MTAQRMLPPSAAEETTMDYTDETPAPAYTLDEIEDYAMAAFDRIRHFDGIDWDGDEDYARDGEHYPGGWIAAVDRPYEEVLDGVVPPELDIIADAEDRVPEQDMNPSVRALLEDLDAAGDVILEHYRPDEIALTAWETAGVDPDLEDSDFYQRVYETCQEDGAMVVDTCGRIAPYTVQLPQMGGEGEGGTRHNAAKGTAHAETYTVGGDPVEFRNVVLSETGERNGEMTVYRASGHPEGQKDTSKRGAEIDVPPAWTEELAAEPATETASGQ